MGLLSTSCPGLFAWHLQKELFFSTLPQNSVSEIQLSQCTEAGFWHQLPGLFLAITCCCLLTLELAGENLGAPHIGGAVEGTLHLFLEKYLESACSLCAGTMLSSRDMTITDVEPVLRRGTHVHGRCIGQDLWGLVDQDQGSQTQRSTLTRWKTEVF